MYTIHISKNLLAIGEIAIYEFLWKLLKKPLGCQIHFYLCDVIHTSIFNDFPKWRIEIRKFPKKVSR